MKTVLAFVLIILVTLSLLVRWAISPTDPQNAAKIEFQISPKQDLDEIGNSLKKQNLIRSTTLFKVYLHLSGLSTKIQAGYFYLSASQNLLQIAQGLTHSLTKQTLVTIPEGLRREEIANLFVDFFQKNKIKNTFNPDVFITKTISLEGQLFPDTYSLPENPTTDQMITLLTGQFNKVVSEIGIPTEKIKETLILASLIERESGSPAESPEIAGILTNRLKGKWPLQVDASVQYALSSSRCRIRICDWWPRPLTKANLDIKSPFNTYENPGLPPSPISNPGRSSLSSAFTPNKTTNWFYLHGLDGSFQPAVTAQQHNANICTYLKKSC